VAGAPAPPQLPSQLAAKLSAKPMTGAERKAAMDEGFFIGLDLWCKATTQAAKDPKLKTDAARRMAVAVAVQKKRPPIPFMMFMRTMASVPPGKRYARVEAEAHGRGRPGWACPAMKNDDKRAAEAPRPPVP
jgi:hypothetical protein